MTGLAEALVALHDRAVTWLRDDRCPLLHVVTTASLRKGTLRTIRALELSPHAPGPFVELDAPHDLGAPGWDARADVLREAHEARREQAGREGEPWPELGPRPAQGGLAGFAEQLGAVLTATPGERPWVVVLEPVFVKAQPHWARAIAMLLRGAALGSVRWIVVDIERSSLGELGVDPGIVRIDVGGEAGPTDAADLPDPSDGSLAHPGACSRVAAPPRRRQAVAPADDPERARRRDLGRHVVAASRAARDQDHAKAVEHQRRARDLCVDAGWPEQQVSMELLLGGYLIAASVPEQAELSHRRAIEHARRVEGRPDLLPLSQIALGSTRMSRGDRPAAMLAYTEAVVSAEPLGAAPLMLEACRLAGDMALMLGMDAQAIAFWGRAVSLAQGAPHSAGLGSAGYSARALALLCEKRGLAERAGEYWDAARQLDGVDVGAIREGQERSIIERAAAERAAAQSAEEPAAVEEVPKAGPTVAPEPVAEPTPMLSTPTAPLLAQVGGVAPSSKTLRLDEPSPAPRPVDEGTANVPIEELAALHWQGVVPRPPPSEIVHRWSASEEDTIRRATSSIITANTTSLMTREEVLAIHGRAALPPAREVTAEATAMIERASIERRLRATEPEAEGTAWISAEQLASIRARFGPPLPAANAPDPASPAAPLTTTTPSARPVSPSSPTDQTAVMSREQVLELARKYATKRTRQDQD